MAEKLVHSAVVLLETPDSFIVQKRPNLPGKLAYPDMKQFLGGHVEEDEDADEAAARELGEETNLSVSADALSKYWSGEYVGKGKRGEPVSRHVSVYYLGLTALGRDSIRLNAEEGGSLVQVPKTAEALQAQQDLFTPFALDMLTKFVKDREG